MRKIVVFTMITLDGVMQAPGGSQEDTADGFKYGGWGMSHFDKVYSDKMNEELSEPFDILLGKTTYEIFARYWPEQEGLIADPFNKATKYVVADTDIDLTWENSVLINGDVVAKIKTLKEEDGPTLQVHGSAKLIQTLLKNNLIDELRLRIYPLVIGSGKRLFAEGTVPTTFELLDSTVTPSGVILANYKRTGELTTGSLG